MFLEGAALNIPTILVGYDGVKGLLDEPLVENAKWWNYSGRGLPNVDDELLIKALVELPGNVDKYLLRNWSEVNSNSDNVWSRYLKTIMELEVSKNEFPTELLELFKAHVGSHTPFLLIGIYILTWRILSSNIPLEADYLLKKNYFQCF